MLNSSTPVAELNKLLRDQLMERERERGRERDVLIIEISVAIL